MFTSVARIGQFREGARAVSASTCNGNAGPHLGLGRKPEASLLRLGERGSRPRLGSRPRRPAGVAGGPCRGRSPRRSGAVRERIDDQRPASEAARRVGSRNPRPPAGGCSGSSASSLAARLINAVGSTCGRWLTNARRGGHDDRPASEQVGRRVLRPTPRRPRPRGQCIPSPTAPATIPSSTDACSRPERSLPHRVPRDEAAQVGRIGSFGHLLGHGVHDAPHLGDGRPRWSWTTRRRRRRRSSGSACRPRRARRPPRPPRA